MEKAIIYFTTTDEDESYGRTWLHAQGIGYLHATTLECEDCEHLFRKSPSASYLLFDFNDES